jgi:hypothetical protein
MNIFKKPSWVHLQCRRVTNICSLLVAVLFSLSYITDHFFQSSFQPEDGGRKILTTLVPVYQTSWYHIPEDSNHNAQFLFRTTRFKPWQEHWLSWLWYLMIFLHSSTHSLGQNSEVHHHHQLSQSFQLLQVTIISFHQMLSNICRWYNIIK